MKILILGSGGREHAMAVQVAKSPHCTKLYVAPGNGGTSEVATNVKIAFNDFPAIKEFIIDHSIEMVIVGPEQPLVEGISDYLANHPATAHVCVIGPSKEGAQLEGSKEFAKGFMQKHGITTASYQSFTQETLKEGQRYLETLTPPYVLKADGLAAGKGVLILKDLEEARNELENMVKNEKFGEAGQTVVIEEFLEGIELSVFVLTDGKNYKILPTAKDYKRIGEGDTGLNTGGMGAISPVPFADEEFMEKVENQIIKPTIRGLQEDQIDYKGFIFFGLIKVNHQPFVIEYNVRMGDPETEAVFPRIKSDLVALFHSVAEGTLEKAPLEIDTRDAATVILVSGGYPEEYEKGKTISPWQGDDPDLLVFHSGTRLESNQLQTNGGRVLAVTALESSFKKALTKAYKRAEEIKFDKKYYRKDIGFDLG